jgi:hypothetical protein
MALSTYPASAGGGIKSVQRGLASSAGTVTITAVDTAKSFVTVLGTTSSGSVAAAGNYSGNIDIPPSPGPSNNTPGGSGGSATISGNFSAGTTNLVTAVIQGYLTSSTALEVSGACRWEVVEFN